MRSGRTVRGAVVAVAAAAAVLALTWAVRAAAGVRSASPWWFEDGYTSLAYVDTAATTAVVDTSGSGTVRLPVRPAALAFDPAASVGLIATGSGVRGWAFDGSAMVRAPRFDVSGAGYVGAAWIGEAGDQLAVATASQVSLEAWNGSGWTAVGSLAASGVNAVAGGPPVAGSPAGILVGTTTGFAVADYRDGGLSLDAAAGVDGLASVGGVASAPGGALAAVWSGTAVRVYGWDGSAYVETPTWEVPAGSERVLAVAWFRDGDGYWLLTADGRLTAYAFDGSVLTELPRLSTTLPLPVAAIGTGWRQGDVAALAGTGWNYYDGAPVARDAARSVTGLDLPLYRRTGVLRSTVLSVAHDLNEIQVDATVPDLPAGTRVAYQVSTDGGGSWSDVPPCIDPANPRAQCTADNTALPPGGRLAYRLLLSTNDPEVTPVVDTTDLFEIANATAITADGRSYLIR